MLREYELNVIRVINYLEEEDINKNIELTVKLNKYGFNLLDNGKASKEEINKINKVIEILNIKL